MKLDSKAPTGDISTAWTRHKFNMKLVNPSNRRKFNIIVVGSGLAGSASAASLAEMGYNVDCFCIQDSPRRAHSIAAQGGINSSKNYPNDGDSVYRLFYDTVKGGDYRSRERNVYRLAEVSGNIIDQCVAQGVPFAREYSGYLANRSFGGAQVSRTFYAKGQTGQQLLLGAYSAISRQINAGKVKMHTRSEMLDVVLVDGKARGIISRNLITGDITRHAGTAVLLCTGGYGNVFFLSTNAMGSNTSAAWRCHKKGAFFANPCYTQIHPTCIPVHGDHQSKLTLMSESLRNDGRVWVPRKKEDVAAVRKGTKKAADIAEADRNYYLEEKYPAFGNLVPRDVASRNAKLVCDAGYGVNETGEAVYLDFATAIERDSEDAVRARYGNLFDMYKQIANSNPYKEPMQIYPAIHYTMGGLWVDYNLMTTIPGLFALGEANFSDHGANRLGASALMQGLADGYFVAPYTVSGYIGSEKLDAVTIDHPAFEEAENECTAELTKLINIKGKQSVDDFHRKLGKLMWEFCGMARTKAGLTKLIEEIPKLRKEFWSDVSVVGEKEDLNITLEKAKRVADFLELGELMGRDALNRSESCGGHFREESQTDDNEAMRNDENFAYVAAWEWTGTDKAQNLHKEELVFEHCQPTQRSYK
ncbi:MAG: fumarate reductase/succinate dehydrogenase flavoprotein subunit [Lentisphaeraceae bacterium]|nr:fumarate reductase/succinate dehydrogenase flavoprotein subunit [Lentisphaeraceae bacterium]